MADQTHFNHIKVTADTDEIVIHAGATQCDTDGKSAGYTQGLSTKHASDHSEQQNEGFVEEGSHQERTHYVSGAQQTPAAGSSDQKLQDGNYHATTLEDIENSKMSATQLVVLGLALMAIAAFIVWYFFFSGVI